MKKKLFGTNNYRVTGSQLDYFRFTQKHNLLRCLSLSFNFEHQLAKNLKTYFWNYVNSKMKVKTGVATLVSRNGDNATTPLQIVEHFFLQCSFI